MIEESDGMTEIVGGFASDVFVVGEIDVRVRIGDSV